jgi:hypothetical protein
MKIKDELLPHAMIDLETLDTKPGGVIAAIGVTRFTPRPLSGKVESYDELKAQSTKIPINLEDSLNLGFVVGGSTLKWWLNQSKEAQASTFNNGGESTVKDALVGLTYVFTNRMLPKPTVWGNDAKFDIGILEAYFDRSQVYAKDKYPWPYNKVRCYRTLRNLMPLTKEEYEALPKNVLAHDCVADAIYQVQTLQAIALKYPEINFD